VSPRQSQFADAVAAKPPTEATLHTAQVVRHLLWHKAMVGDDEDGAKIAQYVDIVQASRDGEHVALKAGFNRDLAIAFELVIQHHLDPWDLDLSKFAELYLKEAKERGVDLVTAGRIILMAWTVLKLQSQDVADRAVIRQAEPEAPGWQDIPDVNWSEDQVDYNARLLSLPKAPIDEKIRHKGDRRVTLMELLSAFEEVHAESQARLILNQEKLAARLSLQRRMRGRVGGMMHKDDLEAEIQETWTRILEVPAHPIALSGICEPSAADVVQTFNAILFLAKMQRIQVTQEDFPRGEVWITPRLPEAATAIAHEVTT
jgi:segregation and condensation protein A